VSAGGLRAVMNSLRKNPSIDGRVEARPESVAVAGRL